MSESIQEELMLEKFEMKGEKASIKEHSSTLKNVEEICTVYVQEEDVKMEGIIRNNLRFKILHKICGDRLFITKYVLNHVNGQARIQDFSHGGPNISCEDVFSFPDIFALFTKCQTYFVRSKKLPPPEYFLHPRPLYLIFIY